MASLYLHIPYCEHKCIYCDFYSIENLSGMDVFVEALEREIDLYSRYGGKETVETIFFGGGTPSLLTPFHLERILARLRGTYSVTHDAEITVEVNPGTVDQAKLADYRSLGVNRLSIGIQSFHEEDLRFLTRIHSAHQAKECVRAAQRVGFANVSIDLIFSLPGQTMDRWQSNIRQALELTPMHISAYSLIVEKGTPLARMIAAKQVAPVPLETDADFYRWTMHRLAEEGYEHYEVSNFARPGYRSRHNSNYWNHANYLGFGPSAHSFWNSHHASAERWWNVADVSKYVEKVIGGQRPVVGKESLGVSQLLEEAIMLGLRSDGIDLELLVQRFEVSLPKLSESLMGQLLTQNLAKMDGNRLRLTDDGYLLCDEIAGKLLADTSRVHALALKHDQNEKTSLVREGREVGVFARSTEEVGGSVVS